MRAKDLRPGDVILLEDDVGLIIQSSDFYDTEVKMLTLTSTGELVVLHQWKLDLMKTVS